jgi:Tfp pilus assembly protein PilZ
MMESSASQSVPASEQRRSKRYRASLGVELKLGARSQQVRTIDVSRHGLFVETQDAPNERFLVQLVIHLADGPLPATAFVSRRVPSDGQRVPGAGLQLFALSAASKTRWDQYIFSLTGLEHRMEQRAAAESARDRAPNIATFLIKLRDAPRLAEFYAKNVRAGGLFMATPLIKETGAEVALIIIHPLTEHEFLLMGRVGRVCRERPKGMEIQLEKLSEKQRSAFKTFVRTGTNPLAKPVEAKNGATPEIGAGPADKDTGDISIDIVVDEGLLEESERFEWSEITNQELIVDDFALVEDESAPPRALTLEGLVATAREPVFTVRVSCRKCASHSRPLVFGGLGGLLGVFASRRPYWCPKCQRFVSVSRLRPAADRKRIQDEFKARGAETLKMHVELAYAFELASISSTPPRCPACGGGVRATKGVKQLQAGLRAIEHDHEERVALKDARCPECGERGLVLECIDELEAHIRIEDPEEDDAPSVDLEKPEGSSRGG